MQFKHNQKFVCYDYETTGLNLLYSEPWQLSWTTHNGFYDDKEFDRFIDVPNLSEKLPHFLKKKCHFNEEKYNDLKKPAKQVLEEFLSFIDDSKYMSIGQNILGFDIYILDQMKRSVGIPINYNFLPRSIDTFCLGKAVREEIPVPRTGSFIEWQYKIYNNRELKSKASLAALTKYLGVPYDTKKHHNAIEDCKMTFEVFKQLRGRLKI